MKIAVPAGAPNLDAGVEHKLGTASYLLVIDMDDMSFEAVEGPSSSTGPGAGVQAVTLVLGMGARILLTGYISPHIARTLQKNGIEVVTSVSGNVRDAVEKYKRGDFSQVDDEGSNSVMEGSGPTGGQWRDALRRAARQFFGILPVLIGVILLVGLFRSFLPREFLMAVFSGDMILDTLGGACVGSILAGNPINSYVIGETLLKMGISLVGVTALMLSWVSVGLVQLPAEMSTLGVRFALIRNIAAFFSAIPASIFIVFLSGGAR